MAHCNMCDWWQPVRLARRCATQRCLNVCGVCVCVQGPGTIVGIGTMFVGQAAGRAEATGIGLCRALQLPALGRQRRWCRQKASAAHVSAANTQKKSDS